MVSRCGNAVKKKGCVLDSVVTLRESRGTPKSELTGVEGRNAHGMKHMPVDQREGLSQAPLNRERGWISSPTRAGATSAPTSAPPRRNPGVYAKVLNAGLPLAVPYLVPQSRPGYLSQGAGQHHGGPLVGLLRLPVISGTVGREAGSAAATTREEASAQSAQTPRAAHLGRYWSCPTPTRPQRPSRSRFAPMAQPTMSGLRSWGCSSLFP